MIYFFSSGIVCFATGLELFLLTFLILDEAAGFVVYFTFSGAYLVEAHPAERKRVNVKTAIRAGRNFAIFLNIVIMPLK